MCGSVGRCEIITTRTDQKSGLGPDRVQAGWACKYHASQAKNIPRSQVDEFWGHLEDVPTDVR